MEKSDVVPAPRIKTLHLFAGAGGGILADLLLGHQPIGAVEIEAYPRKVLLQRQLDGCLPEFPIWDDVRTFRSDNPDTSAYIDRLRGIRNELAICGGFPCQDISVAGRGAGITGERSGLWNEMARIIREIRPRYVFVENSPMLVTRGLDVVLSEIAALGFDARWGVVGAHHAGADHKRERIWILADAVRKRGQARSSDSQARQEGLPAKPIDEADTGKPHWWATEPDVVRVAHGLAARVDRLRAIGNGQVPRVVQIAWSNLDVN